LGGGDQSERAVDGLVRLGMKTKGARQRLGRWGDAKSERAVGRLLARLGTKTKGCNSATSLGRSRASAVDEQAGLSGDENARRASAAGALGRQVSAR
jgi:hypothetical protein